MNKSNASTLRFLEQFFGASNKFDLDKIKRTEGKSAKIRPWVELLTQSTPQPTILPCWRPINNQVDWYGIAFSPKQLRRLSEELMAFVGPTYSTYRGQTAQLNLQDPIEAAINQFTQGNAIKFNGDSSQIWQALERMRQVSARCVKHNREIPRPTGRVLRDFYMALQAGARSCAEQELQYLANQHRLDALNLLFLRVQLLAELEQWNELLTLPELSNLLQVKRPFAVTIALLKAVYQVELLHFEEKNTPSSAIAYFKEFVFPRYQNLFAARAGSKVPEVLKLFMLLAVSVEPKKPALRDELLAIETAEHRNYLERLAQSLPDITPCNEEDPLQQAEKLASEADFDQLFLVLRDVPLSQRKVSLLFQGAYELQTLEAEKTALQAFDELTIEEQTAFLKLRWNQDCLNRWRGSTEEVTNTQLAETIPASWLEWLSQLDKQPTWERALFTARQGSSEWDVTSLLVQPNAVYEFEELLSTVGSKAESVLHNAIPYLLGFFQKDQLFPRSEFFNLYQLLLEILVISTEGGDADLVLFNDLVIALLNLGLDAKKYTDIINCALDLWKRYESPKKVDWALDLLDILVLNSSQNMSVREQTLFTVAESLRNFAGRIDEEQWGILRSLVKDLKFEEAFSWLFDKQIVEQESEVDIFQKLNGKSVLIYTLTETAALRVKSILEAASKVKVNISHDKGGTDRLGQWVKNSDIVLMVTASAKHAATNFIEANRPPHLAPILLVNSKGSASMLRIIKNYLTKIG
ncbi:MAG: hypothetical protein KME29_08360 [Calothrix sp. FI2-JRJ7]|jgi:hypothetical protein|nr:hypothetical protein [Calothrix sp. FI2-JRJ7]